MSRKNYTAAAAAVCAVSFLLLAFGRGLFVGPRPKPEALTRFTIEECERAELKVEEGIKRESLPTNLALAYYIVMKNSDGFKQGYIKLASNGDRSVLDSWGRPLHFEYRSSHILTTNAPSPLLTKSNKVLVWSSGPNGSNEFGRGDDIVVLETR
jgi:hypothetical protein